MTTYIHDGNAVLDYKKDWTHWLAQGETITSHEVIVAPDGITKDSSSFNVTSVTVWLSGGTVGSDYDVTYRITTNQGRVDDRTDRIKVRHR